MDDQRHQSDHSPRKRSRSPQGDRKRDNVKKHRSRSPRREGHRHHHHHHHHRSEHSRKEAKPANVPLPLRSQPLRKHDYDSYKVLFVEYLDLQKQLDIDELSETEIKGRWKSFLGKWNRGELAEGWYDPDMKKRAEERYFMRPPPEDTRPSIQSATRNTARSTARADNDGDEEEDDEDEDDGYGPALPDTFTSSSAKRAGPAIPNFQDLQQKRELAREDRQAQRVDMRYERKEERKAEKARLDELVPRADPGSRERQLEKKRETTAVNRSFREAKSPGAEEVGEKDLMGGEDGIEGYKAELKAKEKVKSERELRKEEVLRARTAEREERLAVHRQKEEKTMDMLRGLAKQRFG